MLILVLLSGLVSVAFGNEVRRECYGQELTIRAIINPRNTAVVFQSDSRHGATRIIFLNETVQDSRYEWKDGLLKVQELTEIEYGTFIFMHADSNVEYDRVIMQPEDCSDSVYLYIGADYNLKLSADVAVVQHSNRYTPSQPVTVWNKTDPGVSKGGRGRVRSGVWVLNMVTHADKGHYTQRDIDGRILSRQSLHIQVVRTFDRLFHGDRLVVPLKIPRSQVQVFFQPYDSTFKQQLVRDGKLLDEQDSYSGRMKVDDRMFEVEDVSSSDKGSYSIRDSDDNLVYAVEVEVASPRNLNYLWLLLLLIIPMIMFIICVKKGVCCKKKPSQASASSQPVMYGQAEADGEIRKAQFLPTYDDDCLSSS
ncbi:hypothetical protein JZ751_008715 [Albula glossodonta]|uniref:Uncharacterized protein n=1 Tax=Albula glossodonta TaxID=121402 RepID=A0A8T2P2M0_9TELE|nr:hypothetical protein JZ751_008715 [Albula glossodonta]